MSCKGFQGFPAEQGFVGLFLFGLCVKWHKPLQVVELATALTPCYRVAIFEGLESTFCLIGTAVF